MYAIVETGGKQVKVSVGDKIFVEKIDGEAGKEVAETKRSLANPMWKVLRSWPKSKNKA